MKPVASSARRLAAALVAVIASVALLIWIGGLPRHATGARPMHSADAVPGKPVAPPHPAASPASAASAAVVVHGQDETQICGDVWIKNAPDGSFDQAALERVTQVPQARAAVLAKLGAEPGEMARLAGVLLAAITSDEQHRAAQAGLAMPCEGSDCAAAQAIEAEVAQARETIARAALASDDPKVYALALNVCSRGRDGTCQLLSAQQWARLDPGNASPWLQILDEATMRKDAAAQTEALYRIATAKRNEVGWLSVSGEVLKAMPSTDDDSMLASLAIATPMVGVEAAWSLPGYSSVIRLCQGDALRDANRAQVCAGVATVLAERSDTVIGRNIGGAIGTRVGWPAGRSERMRAEYNAYVASFASSGAEPGVDLGCARMRRELDRLRQTATLGEVGAMREWVARSGKKADDFVREERVRQRQVRQLGAELAASAASAASATR